MPKAKKDDFDISDIHNSNINDSIIVKWITTNNLKGIDVTLPKNKIITITGVSGSGKSSLAFGTIYKEWQFRYIESLSSYLRQFFNLGDRPDIEYSSWLSPAIAIEQNKRVSNSRSTVGTLTEIDDYLRLLFAKTGNVYCYNCGNQIKANSVDSILDDIYQKYSDSKVYIISEIWDYKTIWDFQKFVKRNRSKMDKSEWYTRFLVLFEENVVEYFYLESPMIPDKLFPIKVYGIYDRITINIENRDRIKEDMVRLLNEGNKFGVYMDLDAVGNESLSLKIGKEVAKADKSISRYTDKIFCPNCNITYPEFTTQHFSSNRQEWACELCHGLWEVINVDMNQIIDSTSTLLNSIIPRRDSSLGQSILKKLAAKYEIPENTTWQNLPKDFQDIIINWDQEAIKIWSWLKFISMTYRGLQDTITSQYNKWVLSIDFQSMLGMKVCTECNWSKLRKESLSVKIW